MNLLLVLTESFVKCFKQTESQRRHILRSNLRKSRFCCEVLNFSSIYQIPFWYIEGLNLFQIRAMDSAFSFLWPSNDFDINLCAFSHIYLKVRGIILLLFNFTRVHDFYVKYFL